MQRNAVVAVILLGIVLVLVNLSFAPLGGRETDELAESDGSEARAAGVHSGVVGGGGGVVKGDVRSGARSDVKSGGLHGAATPRQARQSLHDLVTRTCADFERTHRQITACAADKGADCRRLFDRASRLFGLLYNIGSYDGSRLQAGCPRTMEVQVSIYRLLLGRYGVHNRKMEEAKRRNPSSIPIYVMNNHGYAQRYWQLIFPDYLGGGGGAAAGDGGEDERGGAKEERRPAIVHVDSHFDMNTDRWTPPMDTAFLRYTGDSANIPHTPPTRDSNDNNDNNDDDNKNAHRATPWVFQGAPWPVGQIFHRFTRQMVLQPEWVSTPNCEVEVAAVLAHRHTTAAMTGAKGGAKSGASRRPAMGHTAFCAVLVLRDGKMPLQSWHQRDNGSPGSPTLGVEAIRGGDPLTHNLNSYIHGFMQGYPDVSGDVRMAHTLFSGDTSDSTPQHDERATVAKGQAVPVLVNELCQGYADHESTADGPPGFALLSPGLAGDTFEYSFMTLNASRDDHDDYTRVVSRIVDVATGGQGSNFNSLGNHDTNGNPPSAQPPQAPSLQAPWILDIDLDFFSVPGTDWQNMFFEDMASIQRLFKTCQRTAKKIRRAVLAAVKPEGGGEGVSVLSEESWTDKRIKTECFDATMSYGRREKEAQNIQAYEHDDSEVGWLHRRNGTAYVPESEMDFVEKVR